MSLLVLLPGLSHCVVYFVSIILLIPFLNKKSPKIGGYIGMRLLSYLVLKMVYITVLFVYVVWQGLLFAWLFLMHKLSAWLIYSKYEHKSLCRFHPQCCFYLGTFYSSIKVTEAICLRRPAKSTS